MTEYFISANSFAAPFFSDNSEAFIKAKSPEAALKKFVSGYKHPCGLYAAAVYADPNAYHKGSKPLAKWLCNHELEKMRLTSGLSSYIYCGNGPGRFELNGVSCIVKNPKGGKIVFPDDAVTSA